MKRIENGFFALVLAASVASGAMAEGKSEATASPQGRFRMTMMAQPYAGDLPDFEKSPIGRKIVEYTGTDLQVSWGAVSGGEYMQQVNLSLAAGSDMPMVTYVTGIKSSSIAGAIRAGAFREIGPRLSRFTNLGRIDPIITANASLDGKFYYLYRARDLARGGIIFRKDWLDNLGMKAPTNLDELFKVLEAFTMKDPDRNGKNDTYGLSWAMGLDSIDILSSWFGAPNEYEVSKDGSFIAAVQTAEYLDALNFLRKLYSMKYMNDDFPVVNVNQKTDNLTQGKAGLYFGLLYNAGENRHNDLYKLFPKAELDTQNRISGPKGVRTPASTGFSGGFLFSKGAIKDDASLDKCLAFFDRMADKPMQDLLRWGIEGSHHTLKDGIPTQSSDQNKLYGTEVNIFRTLKTHDGSLETPGQQSPLASKFWDQIRENKSFAIANPAEPLISATAIERGAEIRKLVEDAATKYIIGALDEDGWKKAVDQWLNSGGRKILQEYSAEYGRAKQ